MHPKPLGDLAVLQPVGGQHTIRERNASACAVVRRRDHDSNCSRSPSLSSIATAVAKACTSLPTRTELMHQDTSCPRSGQLHAPHKHYVPVERY